MNDALPTPRRHAALVFIFITVLIDILSFGVIIPVLPGLIRREKDAQPLHGQEVYDLQTSVIIHSLDLMYFWMYQPRARTLLARILRGMTPDECETFIRSQAVLSRAKEISRMFVDGILGNNFSKPLAFFLDSHAQYLADISQASGVRIPGK